MEAVEDVGEADEMMKKEESESVSDAFESER
jgi:hypothetical protein